MRDGNMVMMSLIPTLDQEKEWQWMKFGDHYYRGSKTAGVEWFVTPTEVWCKSGGASASVYAMTEEAYSAFEAAWKASGR